MDKIYNEEAKNLEYVEQQLEKVLNRFQSTVDECHKEIDGFVCHDTDDFMNFRYYRDLINRTNLKIETYNNYMESPYFAKLQFEIDGKVVTFYIGKNEFDEKEALGLVEDWRSPIGRMYYNKTTKSFVINEKNAELYQRMAIDIQQRKLQSYNIEYDIDNISLDGDVIDPFLMDVLKSKRQQRKITDIIRTIQANQNDIIGKPSDESFVVQGCAGSGKTMILLHRLSMLKYNDRDSISWVGTKIITPNKSFNIHLNDLSEELGLNDIERLTVEEYYVQLIHRYAPFLNINGEVESEKKLDTGLLTYIYSEKFADNCYIEYTLVWGRVISFIIQNNIKEIVQKLSEKEFPDLSVYKYETYNALYSILEESIYLAEKNIKRYNELCSEKERINNQISEANTEKISLSDSISDAKNSMLKKAELTLTNIELYKNQFMPELIQCSQKLEEIKNNEGDESNLNQRLKHMCDMLSEVNENPSLYCEYKYYSDNKNEMTELFSNKLSGIILQIKNLDDNIKSVPVYNLILRRRLLNNHKELLSEYRTKAEEFIKQEQISCVRSYEESCERLKSFEMQVNEYDRKQNEMDTIIKKLTITEEECKLVTASLTDIEMISAFDSTKYNDFAEDVTLYNRYVKRYEDIQKRIISLEEIETARKQQIENYDVFSVTDLDKLRECRIEVEKIKINNIINNTSRNYLQNEYKRFHVRYRKFNYRHKLYTMLLFCTFYYSGIPIKDKFLNIDEAQDIAVTEYALIKSIVGTQCVFNLYGDVNQLVYSYKGIIDWSSISNITNDNIYYLNENYRNTQQITEFCNAEFSADIFPVGVEGEKVLNYSLAEAVTKIINMKKTDPTLRTAIIYKTGIEAIVDALKKLLIHEKVSWDIVNDDILSVVTVEIAKGLEFDSVVAVIDQMSDNEKYISFTRALDNLIVVRDAFDENKPDDDFEDESNDALDESYENSTSNELSRNSKDDFLSLFDEGGKLSVVHKDLIKTLGENKSAIFTAPSGSYKSLILYYSALKRREKDRSQTIVISLDYLHENILALTDKFHISTGVFESVSEFKKDIKNEKYDIIFVPAEYFVLGNDIEEFVSFFSEKVSLVAIDNPTSIDCAMRKIVEVVKKMQVTLYVMSREPYEVDFDNIEKFEIEEQILDNIEELYITVKNDEEKLTWISDNIDKLYGKGIVYCNPDSTLIKRIAKTFKKRKISSQPLLNFENLEMANYIMNTFTTGNIDVLITSSEIGTNISNSSIRFIVHFDEENIEKIYNLHKMQLGKNIKDPIIINLKNN